MGRIGEPKREIHIPVPPPAAPVEAPAPIEEPIVEPIVEPAPPVPAGTP
jgi:hypothetical protein